MIFLYTLLLVLLGTAGWLVRRRVGRLERKYVQAAQAAERVARAATTRPGNSGKPDVCLAAKQQYQLGRLVQRREEVEQRYLAWQQFAERFGRLVAGLREWKGKKLPYTFGMLDVAGVLWLIDRFGVGEYVSVKRLYDFALALWAS